MRTSTKFLIGISFLLFFPSAIMSRYLFTAIVPTASGFTFAFSALSWVALAFNVLFGICFGVLFFRFLRTQKLSGAIFFSIFPLTLFYGGFMVYVSGVKSMPGVTAQAVRATLKISTEQASYNNFLWAALATLVYLIAVFLIVLFFCRPLSKVERAANKLGDGRTRFDDDFKVGGGKQFQEIENSLNKINYNFKEKDNKIRQTNLQAQMAQKVIPKQVFKFFGKSNIADLELGNQVKKTATVLFCDLKRAAKNGVQMAAVSGGKGIVFQSENAVQNADFSGKNSFHNNEFSHEKNSFCDDDFSQGKNSFRDDDFSQGKNSFQNETFSQGANSLEKVPKSLSLEENFDYINSYIKIVAPLVKKFDGFIDKYLGDGVLCVFSKPQDAIECAHAILRAIDVKNKSQKNLPAIDARIGISTQPMIFGIVGEEQNKTPTVVSDVLSLGSKMEEINAYIGTKILITKGAFDELPQNFEFDHRFCGALSLDGGKEVALFESLEYYGKTKHEKLKKLKSKFEAGVRAYNQRKYQEAKEFFEYVLHYVPDDKPSYVYFNKATEKLKNSNAA